MTSLTALVVDDEDLARENLKMLLDEFCPEVKVMGMAGSVKEAEEKIRELQPQVVFLDIRMPSGAEGFELLEKVGDQKFMVVFVTAFKDYAVKAFNANAVHYVLKPVDIDDLKAAVEKLVEAHKTMDEYPEIFTTYVDTLKDLSDSLVHNKQSNRITVNHSKGIKVFDQSDITYVEADGNCSLIHFKDGTRYLDTRTLGVYETILNESKFYRIHKSYLINLDHLTEYISEDGHFAVLRDGARVPVARNRVPEFTQRIKSI